MSTTMRAMQRPHARALQPHHPAPPPRLITTLQSGRQPGIPCKAADPELFFAETPAGVEAAKVLCGGCVLRSRCLSDAIERREPCGVWGGELFESGEIVPRKRPRGRPRKRDAERDAAWFDEHAEVLNKGRLNQGRLNRGGREGAPDQHSHRFDQTEAVA